MSKRDDGGTAFPLDRFSGSVNSGMTLLQWYAGLFMQAFLTNPMMREHEDSKVMTEMAVDMAEDLIAEIKGESK